MSESYRLTTALNGRNVECLDQQYAVSMSVTLPNRNEKYGKPKPLTPLWMQQDSFPKWLQAKRVKSPQDAELQRIIARCKEGGDDE